MDHGRAYAGPADLAAMGAALSASWLIARPFVNTTVGDLEWWQVNALPFQAWGERIRLWGNGDEVVAYAWLTGPAELDWHQRADLPAHRRAGLADEAIEWASALAMARIQAATPAGGATDAQAAPGAQAAPPAGGATGAQPATGAQAAPPAGAAGDAAVLTTWAMDSDVELGRRLVARGFSPAREPAYTHWYRRLDRGSLPEVPAVPAGYRIRHVRLPDDLEQRVEVHRSAFAPSRMTVDKYRALWAMPHYAAERDLVVEAPDGSLGAFTLAWWDPEARIGEFEPVGTHVGHRQLGLARALNLAGLRLLRDLGAVDALVFSLRANAASEGLYAASGFEAVTAHRAWTRPLR